MIYDKLLFAYFQESCFIFVNFFMFHQGSSVTLMHFLNVLGLRKIGFLQLAGLYDRNPSGTLMILNFALEVCVVISVVCYNSVIGYAYVLCI